MSNLAVENENGSNNQILDGENESEFDGEENIEEVSGNNELLKLIKKRTSAIDPPVLKFTGDYFPEDPTKYFDHFKFEYINYAKLSKIIKDYEEQWEILVLLLKEYERKVEEDEITQEQILEDIDKFINAENKTNRDLLEHVQSKMDEDDAFQQALEEAGNLFNSYIESLREIREAIAEKSEEEYASAVLEETKKNMEYIDKERTEANTTIKKISDSLISSIVKNTTADMSNKCQHIDKQIEELEEKLRKKRAEIVEMRFLELKAKLSAEIATLRSRKSYLDLQIRTMLDLENSLKELNEELRQEVENTQDTEEFFQNEIQKTMTDPLMDDDKKLHHIQNIKVEFDKAIDEHKVQTRKIELEREVIKKAILDEFELAMSKARTFYVDENGRYYFDEEGNKVYEGDAWVFPEDIDFDFDEFGRFFMDNLGRKIYKEDEESSAYIRDEFGNFIEVYSPKMTGFKRN